MSYNENTKAVITMYEQNDFQKKMLKKYPQFAVKNQPKLEKPRTEEEMQKEYSRAWESTL